MPAVPEVLTREASTLSVCIGLSAFIFSADALGFMLARDSISGPLIDYIELLIFIEFVPNDCFFVAISFWEDYC